GPCRPRRLKVAKYSWVRKLGAFHLMPSWIEGSTARIAWRSCCNCAASAGGCAAMNASTAALLSAPVVCRDDAVGPGAMGGASVGCFVGADVGACALQVQRAQFVEQAGLQGRAGGEQRGGFLQRSRDHEP